MLSLYFGIGEYIALNSRKGFWGTNAIEAISQQLQQELPGLRGFSATNMKNMRLFYEAWEPVLLTADEVAKNRQLLTADEVAKNRQLSTDDLQNIDYKRLVDKVPNRQLATDDFKTNQPLSHFVSIGFTHHVAIINAIKTVEERLFYVELCAQGFWSVEKLKYNLKSDLFHQQGSIVHNFVKTISETDFRGKALQSFKDEYLLDFVNIEDPDEEDERVIENQIVLNIKKFILALGTDFTFIGNQHRLTVDEREFFVDLLFFNRQLQSLIAIDLKKKDFKPEYVGKMNFYLSALDEYEKKPHENPSIGIILCKEKSNKVVEFAFRDTSKPMGVATYRTARELPPQYKGILPDAEKLKELLEE
jgi:predicted nuclease of restriction endonuclease-like (RecB) superfamily